MSHTLKCPHCGEPIEVLEPKDLDELGLTQNPRGAAVREGELHAWAKLRSGKLFLYLRSDVEKYFQHKQVNERRQMIEKMGGIEADRLTDEEITKFFDQLERASKRK